MATTRRSKTADHGTPTVSVSVVEQVGISVRWLAVCGAIAFVAHELREIVAALAGRSTDASIFLSFLADVDVSVWLTWGFSAACLMYARAQKKLREQEIQAQHDHIVSLERQLERRRTSSQLTKSGNTNPKDK